MKGSNLDVQSNEIEIFSSIRSALSPKDEAVAIIDFGAQSTRMYIVRKGIVCRTHSVLLSGSELTQNIADILGIEFRNAEELKRSLGLHGKVDDPRIQKTLVSAIERGFRELHTVIKRYEEAEAITIEKISMCGSGSLLPGLSKYVEDMFSRSVQMADPFSKVAYPAFLEDTLKIAGPSFAIAVGVSLSAFQKKQ
jgi:type IV pilus assembly protein PilM